MKEEEAFIARFIDLFDEPPEVPVTLDTKFKALPGWDSLVALALIVMMSNDHGASIDGERIRSLQTVGELYRHATAA